MNERQMISAKQLAIFIISAQVGLGFLTLPSLLAEEVGHDGWISILIAGVISTIAMIIVMLLLRRYRHRSILEINRILFGRYIGSLVNLLLLSYLAFLSVMAIRIFVEFIKIYQLERLPLTVVSILIILPTLYLAWRGLPQLSRFSVILLFILAAILLLGLTVLQDLRLTFLLPVAEDGVGPLLKGVLPSVLGFLGLELAVFIYPSVKDKDQALKWAVIANLTSTSFFIVYFFIAVSLFGEEMLQRLLVPMFSVARYIRLPGLERVDLLFFLLWFPLLESTFRSYFFATYQSLGSFLNIKKKNILLAILTIVLLALSALPGDLVSVLKIIDLINYSGMSVILYLMLCFVLTLIFRRGR